MSAEPIKRVASFEDLEVFQRAPTGFRLGFIAGACNGRRSNNARWAIRCGGLRSPSARISRRVTVARSSRRRSSNAFSGWRIGSSDEMRVWARYALDLGYVDEQTWRDWRDEYQAISRMPTSLVSKV